MANHVLITGGTGLIGSALTKMLLSKGYNVAHLSRSRSGDEKVKTFTWQVSKNVVEPGAIENADYIIHLAGTNLTSKRWTAAQKEKMEKSRIETSYLLYQKLHLLKHKVKAVVSSSGINYYGADSQELMVTEESPAGTDFLAQLCVKWENTVSKIAKLKIRLVQFRTGPVLSREGGMLKKLVPLAKSGLASPIGTGKQYISWIHIEDLCRLYISALEDDTWNGIYNAVAPEPVTNKEFMKILAKVAKRPFFLPAVPGFCVKLLYGEMGEVILGGVKASSKKIELQPFQYHYPTLQSALKTLL